MAICYSTMWIGRWFIFVPLLMLRGITWYLTEDLIWPLKARKDCSLLLLISWLFSGSSLSPRLHCLWKNKNKWKKAVLLRGNIIHAGLILVAVSLPADSECLLTWFCQHVSGRKLWNRSVFGALQHYPPSLLFLPALDLHFHLFVLWFQIYRAVIEWYCAAAWCHKHLLLSVSLSLAEKPHDCIVIAWKL